ncbi:MAG TPA: hypothetical protein VNM37_23865, partial [Candidatus Dormibacteraeota bacterium]|nr:hypothetical protein [Candidatus Dormibacteraeota bacterium]
FKFKAPIRVHQQMPATHEPTLTRPCGHPLPSSGRGAGGEGSFSVEVHGPNSRAHGAQVEALHEPTQLSISNISNFQFSIAAQLGIGN